MSETTFVELLDLYVDAITENLRETDYRVKYGLPQTAGSRRRDAHELDTRDAVLKKVAELEARLAVAAPMNPAEQLDALLKESGLTVKFGLRAQGHIPTIQRMLTEGKSWDEIGKAIGWHPPTAKEWYEREERVACNKCGGSGKSHYFDLGKQMDCQSCGGTGRWP